MGRGAAARMLEMMGIVQGQGLGPRKQVFPAGISDTHLYFPLQVWLVGLVVVRNFDPITSTYQVQKLQVYISSSLSLFLLLKSFLVIQSNKFYYYISIYVYRCIRI